MKLVLFLSLVNILVLSHAGLIKRQKRGFLSRTGICPNPVSNFGVAKKTLNFWGVGYVVGPPANCHDSDCKVDRDCNANEKCCKNSCGSSVCTPAVRHPEPCSAFKCPAGETCKIQKVKCIMPDCPDADAINRPSCVASDSVPAPLKPPGPPVPVVAPPQAPPMLAYADPNLTGAQTPSTDVQQQYASPESYDPNAAVTSPEVPPTSVEQQFAPTGQSEAMYPQQPMEGQNNFAAATL